jgi:hypothetical protein
MKKIIFTLNLAALIILAAPAYCDEFSDSTGLNLNIPKIESKPVFIVDKSASPPGTVIYIEEIEKKIQQSLADKKLSIGNSAKKMQGIFDLHITLQRDGHIDEVQVSPADDAIVAGDFSAFAEVITRSIKAAEPYSQFPPGLFSGYDLIAFESSVEFNNANSSTKPSKPNRHRGASQPVN